MNIRQKSIIVLGGRQRENSSHLRNSRDKSVKSRGDQLATSRNMTTSNYVAENQSGTFTAPKPDVKIRYSDDSRIFNNSSSQITSSKIANVVSYGRRASKQNHSQKMRMISPVKVINCTNIQSPNGKEIEFVRKIRILENRISEIHQEKQQMANSLNERLRVSQNERQILLQRIRFLEGTKQRVEEDEDFNIKEMLENQISINLQIREELQNYKEKFQNQLSQQNSKNKELQEQNHKILNQYEESQRQNKNLMQKLQVCAQLETKAVELQSEINSLQSGIKRRQESIEEMLGDKQRRILELQGNVYDMEVNLDEKNKDIIKLQEEVASYTVDKMKDGQEIETLRSKNEQIVLEMSKKQNCDKCSGLLKTVFRLNNQLNTKK